MTDRNALANALMGRSLLDEPPTDMRQQIANALMQPSTADIRNTPAQRGSILPLAIYGDGSARPAMPEGLNRLLEIVTLQRRPDASEGDALLIGGAPALGAAPFAPRGAVGSAGGRLGALPMDEASRMARAKELGFHTKVYHGTHADFEEFDPTIRQFQKNLHRFDQIHTTTARPEAEIYGPNVKELMVRGSYKDIEDPMTMQEEVIRKMRFNQQKIEKDFQREISDPNYAPKYNYETLDRISRYLDDAEATHNFNDAIAHKRMIAEMSRAKKEGFDGIRIKGGWSKEFGGDHYIPFDPTNIRSVDAAFDPAKSNSANLLAANPSTASINALIAMALQNYQNE